MKTTTLLRLGLVLLLSTVIWGCAKPQQQPLPVGNLRLGVAQFTQPSSLAEMLAGYMPEQSPRIDQTVLQSLDSQFAAVLAKESKNSFLPAEQARQCYAKLRNEHDFSRQAALRTWSMVGRCMGVDILLVPQTILWQERQGSNYGAVIPAGFSMDTFVIDVNGETLISRSHFEEVQAPLSQNLLDAGKFISRGGRWVPATELAGEAMKQAVKELGL